MRASQCLYLRVLLLYVRSWKSISRSRKPRAWTRYVRCPSVCIYTQKGFAQELSHGSVNPLKVRKGSASRLKSINLMSENDKAW